MDVDVVVLWVDGNDPEWQKEKAKYQGVSLNDSNSFERYRDWGLMKYWFRSIEEYMPWVRKIHFVTCGHVPSFLNLNNPKLHHVRHKDFIPEQYLPTFSSHAIELNIHRIKDLSDHFIYFNDDIFVLRKLEQDSFFKNGKPCAFVSESSLPIRTLEMFEYAAFNDIGVLNMHFKKKEQVKKYKHLFINKEYPIKDNIRTLAAELLYPNLFVGFSSQHAPNAYLKNTFEEVWKAEPERLLNTTMNKFRCREDLNQWIMLWWQVVSGNFVPYRIDNNMVVIYNDTVEHVCEIIRNQSNDFITLNDRPDIGDFEGYSKRIRDTFESILPNKCSFEI